MPITVEWDDAEETILRADTSGKWTWEEYHIHLDETFKLIRSLDYTVHLINVRHADSIQPKGSAIPHITRAFRSMPDNHGITVNVGMNTLGNTMFKLFRTLFPKVQPRFFMAQTLEEARQMIAEHIKQKAGE